MIHFKDIFLSFLVCSSFGNMDFLITVGYFTMVGDWVTRKLRKEKRLSDLKFVLFNAEIHLCCLYCSFKSG